MGITIEEDIGQMAGAIWYALNTHGEISLGQLKKLVGGRVMFLWLVRLVLWPIWEVFMPDPTWQALYRAALVEPDPIRLNGRIEAARRFICQRLEQIEDSGDTRKRQQLNDALGALFALAARK
jgi:hypothetical protein